MKEPKLILFIAMSLDGYIAGKNDELEWLDMADKEGLDYGYYAMTQRTGSYITGRRTYEVVLKLTGGKFPPAENKKTFILTHEDKAPENNVTFYNGDIGELISNLKAESGKDIYCDGGGIAVREFMKRDLIDEYIISILPISLGDGIRLFMGGTPTLKLKLVGNQSYETGLVQVHYLRDRS